MTTEDVVFKLGVPGHIKGHRALSVGAALILENPDIRYEATNALYPEIARIMKSKPKNIEHNIRTAIEKCWAQKDHTFLEEIAMHAMAEPPKPVALMVLIAACVERENSKASNGRLHQAALSL